MIRSMTGFGAADRVDADGVGYVFEARTVNHRYLKLAIKLPEFLQFAEPAVEKVIRSRISRGSVTCTLRVRGSGQSSPVPIDLDRLQQYVDRLTQCRLPNGVSATVDLAALASLPGVLAAVEPAEEVRRLQHQLAVDLAGEAFEALVVMRCEEGVALRADLCAICATIGGHLELLAERAPVVVEEYHERLRTRVATLMQEGGFELQEDGLMREVALFAERSDISEEVARLRSHLEQFATMCDREEPTGRSLDFLSQEMLREANTIASKSNDSAIARCVVEIKGQIDRLKEQVQNAE